MEAAPAEPEGAAPVTPLDEPAPPPADPAPAVLEPSADAAVVAPKPKPAPYSLPFQLRPVLALNVVRLDTSIGFYENPASGESGNAVASMLLLSKKITDDFAPLLRFGVVSNNPPEGAGDSAVNFLNPVIGAAYALTFGPEWKLGLFLGVAVPVGSGGGNDPEPERGLANATGIRVRSAMDNAMFAVNDFTVFPGVGLAYVAHGLTVQAEVTVLQLTRVRGDEAQPDKSKTNFTTGLHAGYFFAPWVSAAVELRHQRWLSTPKFVENDATDTLRDTTTVAFGPRFHAKLGETLWMRPGISLTLPIDDPMQDSKYKIVQLDFPFPF